MRTEEIKVLPGTPVKLVGVLIVYSVPLPVRKEGFNKLARMWMSVEYPPTTIHS